jgi:hypothetical protein
MPTSVRLHEQEGELRPLSNGEVERVEYYLGRSFSGGQAVSKTSAEMPFGSTSPPTGAPTAWRESTSRTAPPSTVIAIRFRGVTRRAASFDRSLAKGANPPRPDVSGALRSSGNRNERAVSPPPCTLVMAARGDFLRHETSRARVYFRRRRAQRCRDRRRHERSREGPHRACLRARSCPPQRRGRLERRRHPD